MLSHLSMQYIQKHLFSFLLIPYRSQVLSLVSSSISFFFCHFLEDSFLFFVKTYIYSLVKIVKSFHIAIRMTVIRKRMNLKRRFYSNQSKHTLERPKYLDDEPVEEDDDDDGNSDSEDTEILPTLRDSSDKSDDRVVEKSLLIVQVVTFPVVQITIKSCALCVATFLG